MKVSISRLVLAETMTDKYIQWVIDDQVIEKYVSKCIPYKSDYLKEEAKQVCWEEILKSNYLKADNPKQFIQRVINNQLVSDSSAFYNTYVKHYKRQKSFADWNNNGNIYEAEDDSEYNTEC